MCNVTRAAKTYSCDTRTIDDVTAKPTLDHNRDAELFCIKSIGLVNNFKQFLCTITVKLNKLYGMSFFL